MNLEWTLIIIHVIHPTTCGHSEVSTWKIQKNKRSILIMKTILDKILKWQLKWLYFLNKQSFMNILTVVVSWYSVLMQCALRWASFKYLHRVLVYKSAFWQLAAQRQTTHPGQPTETTAAESSSQSRVTKSDRPQLQAKVSQALGCFSTTLWS